MFNPHLIGSYLTLYVALILVMLWPKESLEAGLYLGLQVKLFFLRIKLAVYTTFLVLQLRRQFRQSGLPVPPFRWSMIWPSLDEAS